VLAVVGTAADHAQPPAFGFVCLRYVDHGCRQ
jgi:hypothetical protein